MGLSTLTLTASGRLPGALSGTPSASTVVRINSGVIALMPHINSGFTCCYLSCLGIDSVLGATGPRGMIGVPHTGEGSGTIKQASGLRYLKFGPVNVERITGTTLNLTGGGLAT